ncbi:MAG: hypothetical protein S4CHLAM7_13330 [Chlamydiae bacterium]|nr:hypothetical protein [Chlamydiota bacterium]
MTVIFFIAVFAYAIIPLYLIYRIYKNFSTSYIDFLATCLCSFSYLLAVSLIGNWSLFPFSYLKYPLLIAFFFVSYKNFKNVKRKWILKPIKLKKIGKYSLLFFLFSLYSYQSFQACLGFISPKNTIELAFPLQGKNFCVIHGGAHEIINHHQNVCAQKYALDITKTDWLGRRAKAWVPKLLDDFFVYESQVVSPCNGKIIKALDCFPDQSLLEMDCENVCGNHIVIFSESHQAYIVLAHLKKDTLLVKVGDEVKKEQPLALVGNSGHSSEPHLHIHCSKSNNQDYLYDGEGIPIHFDKKFLVRNQRVSTSEHQ